MNQKLIAHGTGWVAFIALAIALSSGYIMALPWPIKRKMSLGWHRTWTIIAITAIGVHVASQKAITAHSFWVILGWVSLGLIIWASLNRWPHKWIGLAAYGFGLWHVVWFAKRNGDGYLIIGPIVATAVIVWLLGARYKPQTTPRFAVVKRSIFHRYSTEDGAHKSMTKWALWHKVRDQKLNEPPPARPVPAAKPVPKPVSTTPKSTPVSPYPSPPMPPPPPVFPPPKI